MTSVRMCGSARRSIKGTRGNHYSIYTRMAKKQFLEGRSHFEIGRYVEAINWNLPTARILQESDNGSVVRRFLRFRMQNGSISSQLEDLRRYIDRSDEISAILLCPFDSYAAPMGSMEIKKGL